MCSGRIDLEFILRAFATGQDGVLIGGCRLGECNYITHGNYDALSTTYICKKLMDQIGLNPERLRIQFMSGADGLLLVETVGDFTKKVKALGPIGQAEGLDSATLRFKLEALSKLIPYIRLVEREKMRIPKTQEAYREFYTSAAFDRLFESLIVSRFGASQISLLLQAKPLSTGAIAQSLGLSPSDVSRHLHRASRQGLVRYDVARKCYAPA